MEASVLEQWLPAGVQIKKLDMGYTLTVFGNVDDLSFQFQSCLDYWVFEVFLQPFSPDARPVFRHFGHRWEGRALSMHDACKTLVECVAIWRKLRAALQR